jgi:hydroxymethylbilane synthase
VIRRKIVIGSRGSDLALWQAYHIKGRLEKLGAEVSITIIKTKGDKIQHLSFDKIEGKGFFTKELEDALVANEIDLAVHSYKDLETNVPEGLRIAAVSERANPADVLLISKEKVDLNAKWEIAFGVSVGTSSARRKMQIHLFRSDLHLEDIRGNVPTRIDKLRSGQYDAIVLAKAGLDRLDLDVSDLHVFEFNPSEFIPAPAQGVLACQIREADKDLADFIAPIHNEQIAEQVDAERKVLNLFKGGCQLPLGAYCTYVDGFFTLRAIMAHRYGDEPVQSIVVGQNAPELSIKAVGELKKKLSPSAFS